MQAEGEALRIIPALKRQAPGIKAELAQWTPQDWQRRTGYLRPSDTHLAIQLREGVPSLQAAEYSHYRYAERFGFSWLQKPDWSALNA
ncbi:MAG: hypothetical protein IGS03_04635 [Candidatus Sericytochromatia bacterium]|nr:hypothetical protein [Candidatus Sericytochromatia bacterium]